MTPIDGNDYLFMPFVHSCALLLVMFWAFYTFIVGSVNCAYICGHVVDLGEVMFWVCALDCVYCVFVCNWLVVAP